MNVIYDFNNYTVKFEPLIATIFFAFLGFIFYIGNKYIYTKRSNFRFLLNNYLFKQITLGNEEYL